MFKTGQILTARPFPPQPSPPPLLSAVKWFAPVKAISTSTKTQAIQRAHPCYRVFNPMPSRSRHRSRGSSSNRGTSSRTRRLQADQNSPSSRLPDIFQVRRRSIRIAQHHEDLLQGQEDEIISEVTANMTDIARRTYPRNDAGPRIVDPR